MITDESRLTPHAALRRVFSNKSSRRSAKPWLPMIVIAAGCVLFGSLKLVDNASGPSSAGQAAPPFLVSLGLGTPRAGLTVLSAASGKAIAKVRPPAGLIFRDTAPTADSHAYVVAAEPATGGCNTFLYHLQLAPDGGEAALTRLKIPAISGEILSSNDLSVSANGQVVAYSSELCNAVHSGVIGVADMATGKARSWGLRAESAWSVSLSPSGGVIGFVNSVVYGGDGTVRTLQVSAPSGSAIRLSRIVLRKGNGIDVNGSIAMAPGGKVMVACSEGPHSATLSAYNADDGARIAVINTWSNVVTAPCEIGLAPSGRYAVVYNLSRSGATSRVSLETGRATPLGATGKYAGAFGFSW